MGVQNLWSILSPVHYHKNLSELEGQIVAVDLSIWVCESQAVKQMQAVVLKPFLRNLFFRITNLTQLGIKLVFVIEGEAPELKCETMMKRQKSHQRGRCASAPKVKRTGRGRFKARLKECCEMLDYLGIPWVQSHGEAEAMCAFLNAKGLVDACITQDGDAFLYGARVVYRNFTLNIKDPHIDCYCMDDIETRLGLNQRRLVGLGIVLGCDYVPKGVPGVGKDGAMKLMNALDDDVDILQRFSQWRQGFQFQSPAERDVMRKALRVADFPNQAVIDEFLVAKDKFPKQSFNWTRPNLHKIKIYNQVKLDWPDEYTEDKVLPMVSSHDMNQIIRRGVENCPQCLKPVEIVKTRVRQGVKCVEVNWQRQDIMARGDAESPEFYTTVEKLDLFSNAFPEVVRSFMDAKDSKTNRKSKKASKGGCELKEKSDVDSLTDAVAKVSLAESNDNVTDGNQIVEHPKSRSNINSRKESKKDYSKENMCSPNEQCISDVSDEIKMVVNSKTKGSIKLRKESKRKDSKEVPTSNQDIETVASHFEDILTLSDVNHQQHLQHRDGNQHDKETKMPNTKATHLLDDSHCKIIGDNTDKNDRKNEQVTSKTTEKKISKSQRRKHVAVKNRKSSKNLNTCKTNLKRNNKASHTSNTSVDGSKPDIGQLKDYAIDLDLEDSWFEELFFELEANCQKERSGRLYKMDDKVITKNGRTDTNCQKVEGLKCQNLIASQSDSKSDTVYRAKVSDVESEVLPLCERLKKKSVAKKNNQHKKEKKKNVKKIDTNSEIRTEQFEGENYSINSTKSHEDEARVESMEDVSATNLSNIATIGCSGMPHQSTKSHSLLSDVLKENDVGESLKNEAITDDAEKANFRQEQTSLCVHSTHNGDCPEEANTDDSILANDTKLNFTGLLLSSFLGTDQTRGANGKEAFPQKNDVGIVDISFEGQIQKDFPGLFDCTLPTLLTGGVLVSPVINRENLTPHGLISPATAKYVVTNVGHSPDHDENHAECILSSNRNDEVSPQMVHPQVCDSPEPVVHADQQKQAKRVNICHPVRVKSTSLQFAESPEPVSLADRLKQRLGKCKDVKTLQTMVSMKNDLKFHEQN